MGVSTEPNLVAFYNNTIVFEKSRSQWCSFSVIAGRERPLFPPLPRARERAIAFSLCITCAPDHTADDFEGILNNP
jgi:hypothetical protein